MSPNSTDMIVIRHERFETENRQQRATADREPETETREHDFSRQSVDRLKCTVKRIAVP